VKQKIDKDGLLERFPDTNGWSSAGVKDVEELHPDSIPTPDEIGEVLEYVAINEPALFGWLIIGLPADYMVGEGGRV